MVSQELKKGDAFPATSGDKGTEEKFPAFPLSPSPGGKGGNVPDFTTMKHSKKKPKKKKNGSSTSAGGKRQDTGSPPKAEKKKEEKKEGEQKKKTGMPLCS